MHRECSSFVFLSKVGTCLAIFVHASLKATRDCFGCMIHQNMLHWRANSGPILRQFREMTKESIPHEIAINLPFYFNYVVFYIK